MKTILVGHGYFGSLYRERIQADTEFKLVGVCDPDYQRLAPLSGATIGEKYDDLADNVEHDAVIICTPPHLHTDITLNALMRKKHVLCMKPGVMSEKDLTMIHALSRKDELTYMIDYTMLAAPENAYLDKQFYWIGNPDKMSSNRLVVGKPKPEGPVWDLLPHDVAAYHQHFVSSIGIDPVTSVSCVSDEFSATARLISDDQDIAYLMAAYDSVTPMKTIRFDVRPDRRVVTNPRFLITWDQNKRAISTETQGNVISVFFANHPDPITLALRRFGREVDMFDLTIGAVWDRHEWVTRILSAMHHSSENDGAIVKVSK